MTKVVWDDAATDPYDGLSEEASQFPGLPVQPAVGGKLSPRRLADSPPEERPFRLELDGELPGVLAADPG